VCVVGNGLFLTVLLKTSSLHTPANVLIGSLAVADFFIGAVVQPQMCAFVHQKNLYQNCDFVDAFTFLSHMLACISGTTMAAISCERYIALFYHLRYTELVTKKRVTIVIIGIWVFWFIIDALTFLGSLLQFVHDLRAAVAILAWLLCCGAIIASYFKIFLLARRHQRQICQAQPMANPNNRISSSQLKLAVTMGHVICVSLLCYIPACIVFSLFASIHDSGTRLFNAFILTMSIQFVSSSFNPVLYCWRSQEIRHAMVVLFRNLKNTVL
jgi:hypothetical protein